MIQDKDTNFLYLADCLPKKYPTFFQKLEQLLGANSIKYDLLTNTKDIWAVDYMPVQIEINSFVNFVYNPRYLKTKSGQKTISAVPQILNAIGITAINSNVVLDGGNVVKGKDTIIMCDRVFSENPGHSAKMLIQELEDTFQVDKVIFITAHKKDFTGHADGMVRFINDDTVLINRYADTDKDFSLSVKLALHNAGLTMVEMPYNPYNNLSNDDACGIYINYLEMDGLIVVPTFNIAEDEEAIKLIEQVFPDRNILTVNSSEIAKKGGILNCISWNIKVS